MCCEQVERLIGRYLDGDLAGSERAQVEGHLRTCARCRGDLEELRDVTAALALDEAPAVPPSLWERIERQLDLVGPETPSVSPGGLRETEQPRWRSTGVGVMYRVPNVPRAERRTSGPRLRGRRWAMAAGIVLTVGLGVIGLATLDMPARAASVDFSVLLDALPLDPQKAFRKFLVRYDARPMTPIGAKRFAPDLSFETPYMLPGGFRLQAVYRLRFGDRPGVAAAYERDGEFLAAVFHPPVRHERFGTHDDFPCVIGQHCGHKVQVGDWTLVHLTDPTTCHCVLSRLDERTELPAVMAAVAPTPPRSRTHGTPTGEPQNR